jgi:hypothetical protein
MLSLDNKLEAKKKLEGRHTLTFCGVEIWKTFRRVSIFASAIAHKKVRVQD